MHIFLPETENCPWISGRERMTLENISWSRKNVADLTVVESAPPDHRSDRHPTEPLRPAIFGFEYLVGRRLILMQLSKPVLSITESVLDSWPLAAARLILKMATATEDNLNVCLFLLYFNRNKTWHFMWIICDDSHDMSSLVSHDK